MNATADNDWHELNYSYLAIAAQQVHQLLERHADPNQVQPETATESILAAIASTLPTPPALEQLVTIFNLSSFERDILLLCVAMEIIPNFKLLCAKVQRNPELNYPTWGLAQTVFPSFNWGATKLNATLLSWQLIEIKQGATKLESRLQINDRVFYYLLGESCPDAQMVGIVNPLPLESTHHNLLPPSHQKLAVEIRDAWSGDMLPVVQLCGADLVDKCNVAAAASSLMGCSLDTISAVYLPSDPNQLYHLRRCVEREAILNNSIVLLECDEVSLKDPAREQAISLFIEGIGIKLIVSSRSRIPQKQRPLFTLDVPKLTKAEQRTIWQDILGSAAQELNGQVDALVSQFNLSMPAIKTAGGVALNKLNQDRSSSPTNANNFAQSLWNTCRNQARPRLDDLATRIETTFTWDNLILPAAQCKMLR